MLKSRSLNQEVPPARNYGDGKEIANLLLLDIPRQEWSRLSPSLELVRLKLHQVLHEAGEAIKSIYFLNSGFCTHGSAGWKKCRSWFNRQRRLCRSARHIRLQNQSPSNHDSVRRNRLPGGRAIATEILPDCPAVEKQRQRFAMILGMQSTQLAACNRLHDVEERLARWLLRSHDRIGGDNMPFTQEFLGQMLETRRSSVSMAANILQKAGIITYTRANVTIVDKRKLTEAACDCYEIIQNLQTSWKAE